MRGLLLALCLHGSLGQQNASAWNFSVLAVESWPACPEQGCLPCPQFASGRPNCSCLLGYSLTARPFVNGSEAVRQPLPWDNTNGWVGECLAVDCGTLKPPPRTSVLGKQLFKLRFNTKARFLCDLGYSAAEAVRPAEVAVGLDRERVVEMACSAEGDMTAAPHCLPVCGDARLVPTEHLAVYGIKEQCDDGNRRWGDGCDPLCRVEKGYVCTGGNEERPDNCRKTPGFAEAVLMVSITGTRAPDAEEVGRAALVALAAAVRLPERDLEISSVRAAPDGKASQSGYHSKRVTAEATLRVKVSDVQKFSLPEIQGALTTVGVIMPRIDLAFREKSSLGDLYVRTVSIHLTGAGGTVQALGAAQRRAVRETVSAFFFYLGPITGYFLLIGLIVPSLYWLLFIGPRRQRLMGYYRHIHPVFKGQGWIYNICACIDRKAACCCLVFTLPARLADSWDAVGLLKFREGVFAALCCCLMYLSGCCLCGACIAGRQRSNLKDFFGFGDKEKNNIDLSDYCCYLCCPVCCVVQEACHVDGASVCVKEAVKNGAVLQEGSEADERSSSTGRTSNRGASGSLPALPPIV